MPEWVVVLLSVSVGAGLKFLTDMVQRRWTLDDVERATKLEEERQRRQRAQERGETAARTMLMLLETIRLGLTEKQPNAAKDFAAWQEWRKKWLDPTEEFARHVLLVPDERARRYLATLVNSVHAHDTIMDLTEDYYYFPYTLQQAGREVLGAVLRGEEVSPHPRLEKYEEIIDEDDRRSSQAIDQHGDDGD